MTLPNPLLPYRPSIRRRFFAAFGFALVMLAGIFFITWKSAEVFLDTGELVGKSRETLAISEKAMRYIWEMEVARRDFLARGDDVLMQDYNRARMEVVDAFHTLREMFAGRPDQIVRITRLQSAVTRIVELEMQQMDERRAGPPPKDGARAAAPARVDALLDPDTFQELGPISGTPQLDSDGAVVSMVPSNHILGW